MVEIAEIARQIWDMKYRLKDADGTPLDASVEATWARAARALAEAEPEEARERHAAAFQEAMTDFAFLPAGRILAGAGSGRSVTLFNCYVMGTIPDDMGSIFAHLREAALTLQQGGGIGYDFSTLRPRGAPVKGVGADASGPLSFMDVWDAMCRTIMSAGSRRGAMMATLRCDHPDVEAFVDAKRDPQRLRMFNLSVLVTDAFMEAVERGADWPLVFEGAVFRTVPARALWDRIMRATYDYAEPGVIFIDRINERNNLAYCETISSTNPCGEQPLPPYGACLLGSLNLARLVERPFEPDATLNVDRLGQLVPVAVRMMDNVVDVSRFPLTAQAEEARNKRRIGLGVTGLADALIMLGLRYGSPEAAEAAGDWMRRIRDAAYAASVELAAEKGPFPLFDADAYLAGETIAELPESIRKGIATHGIRNGLLTSIAPTGTISLFADNVSSGIEPVFSFTYRRAVLLPDGTRQEEEVSDFAYRLFRRLKGPDAPLPDAFVDAQSLAPHDHLVMQAAVQAHVDSSISKTINCPEDITFEAFRDVYAQAYALGCKGCTTYRPNPVTGAVLSTLPATPPAPASERGASAGIPVAPAPTDAEPEVAVPGSSPGQAEPMPAPGSTRAPGGDASVVYMTRPLDRPPSLPGNTYKLRWPDSDHALYITVNDIVQDGRRRPFEVFINSKNMEHYAWTVALTRMISAVFRRGGDVSFVVEELKAVFDPRGGQWMKGRYVPSLLAAIGNVIEQHMIEIGFLPGREATTPARKATAMTADGTPGRPPDQALGRPCPKCGQPALIRQEGCDTCTACDYSKCG